MPSLGEDISSLRKKEKLSIQDIFDSTRIPQNILREIENGNIFKDKSRNKTYVRSFVRTYAKALKISEDDIVQALDETEGGHYSGLIARKYGLTPKDESDRDIAPKDYEPKFRLGDSDIPDDSEKTETGEESKPDEQQEKPAGKKPQTEETPAAPSQKNELETPASKTTPAFSRPDPTKDHNKMTPQPPTVDKVNWVDMVKKANAPGGRSAAVPLISIVAIAILIVAGYFAYNYFFSKKTASISRHRDGISTDTVASVPVTGGPTASGSVKETKKVITATNPDTLYLTIYAAKSRLDPVRVQSDVINQLNPYWIEKGQAMNFEFIKKISIKGQFSRMLLLMNGHLIPNFRQYEGQDTMIHLTRSLFENDRHWVSPAPDTLENGVVQPDSILSRPVFY